MMENLQKLDSMSHLNNRAVDDFVENVSELWVPSSIERLSTEPDPLTFMREYVSRSMPCIIPYDGPGVGLTLDDLVDIMGDHASKDLITVDTTPDGWGDCVRCVYSPNDESDKDQNVDIDKTTASNSSSSPRTQAFEKYFVQPEERKMTLTDFRFHLRQRKSIDVLNGDIDTPLIFPMVDPIESERTVKRKYKQCRSLPQSCVFYYSRQNDCLRTELNRLFEKDLFPRCIPFAEKAFGPRCSLEAVNLWIGDERVTSSMHKDYYENLFIVLSGEKIFTLCPPCDVLFIPEHEYFTGRFRYIEHKDVRSCSNPGLTSCNGYWAVKKELDDNEVVIDDNMNKRQYRQLRTRWIEPDVTIDVKDASIRNGLWPSISKSHPFEVRVRQGEMLYLPSLWLHRVTQSQETVGVNYWYDMRFDDPKFIYSRFLQNMGNSGIRMI
mmetsp:Transcript_12378/g.16150  ORF Transcript_12378/g.16150 Transcript_12378/m.16150 type:complete len:437 (-) Transcript_12378:2788-4098(-)